MNKETYLQLRLSKEQKETIRKNAKMLSMSMAGYLWFLVLKNTQEENNGNR